MEGIKVKYNVLFSDNFDEKNDQEKKGARETQHSFDLVKKIDVFLYKIFYDDLSQKL
jgi:hypothetical protein